MTDLKNGIVVNKSEYLNRTLLLARRDLNGLYLYTGNSALVILKFDKKGNQAVSEYRNNEVSKSHLSFDDIYKSCLKLKDISLDSLFRYFVSPEMEVERIFNSVRFKYLTAIYLSEFGNPQKFVNSAYNRAFQSLAGLQIYQGSAKQRKNNNSFWQDAGFAKEAKSLNWEKDRNELQTILSLMKLVHKNCLTRSYAELIAIKPGFHELFIHNDYFEKFSIPEPTSPRNIVFRTLRNKGSIATLKLKKLPGEINKNSYFSYAPCNVTEGPFVFRKNIDVSYYDAIRCIKSKGLMHDLQNKFHILDYFRHDITTRRKLAKFLETAQAFCNFLT